MLYIQQSLGPDEELVHVGQFHWMYTVSALFSILFGLVACIMFLIGAVFVYAQMGKMPHNITLIQGFALLHPGIRIVAFIFFALGLLGFAQKMIIKATTEIAITNSRLVYKRGLIARYVGEMSVDRIEGVTVLQSILGRLLNYGRLAVRGMGVGEVILPPIADPIAFRQSIEKARSL